MSELLTAVRLIPNGHLNAFARIVDNLYHDSWHNPTFVAQLLA
jgi:hypothetical protein